MSSQASPGHDPGYESDSSSGSILLGQYQAFAVELHNLEAVERFWRVHEAIPATQKAPFLLKLEQSDIVNYDGETQEAAFSALEDSLENRESILNPENLVFAQRAEIKGVNAKSSFLKSTAKISPKQEPAEFHAAIENSTILDCDGEMQSDCFEALATSPSEHHESILNPENVVFARRLTAPSSKYWFLKSVAEIPPQRQAAFRDAIGTSTILTHDDVTQTKWFAALGTSPPKHRESILNPDILVAAQRLKTPDAKYWYLKSSATIPQKQQGAFHEAIETSTILDRSDDIQETAFQVTANYPEQFGSILKPENLDFAEQPEINPSARYSLLESAAAISPKPEKQAAHREAIKTSGILNYDGETQEAAFQAMAESPERRESLLDGDTLALAAQIQGADAKYWFFKSAAAISPERDQQAALHAAIRTSTILDYDAEMQSPWFEALATSPPERREPLLNENNLIFAEQAIRGSDATLWFLKSTTSYAPELQTEHREAIKASRILNRDDVTQAAAFEAITKYPEQFWSIVNKDNLDLAEQVKGHDAKFWFLAGAAAISSERDQQDAFREAIKTSRILSCDGDTQEAVFRAATEFPQRRESILNKENLDIAEQLKGLDAKTWFSKSTAAISHASAEQTKFRNEIKASTILDCDGVTQAAAFQATVNFPEDHELILVRDNVALAVQIQGLDAKSSFFNSMAMPWLDPDKQGELSNDVRRSTILNRDDVTQAAVFKALEDHPENRRFVLHQDTLNVVEQLKTTDAKSSFFKSTAKLARDTFKMASDSSTEVFPQEQQVAFRDAVRGSTILGCDGETQTSALEALEESPQHHESILNKNSLDFAEKLEWAGAQLWFFKSLPAIPKGQEAGYYNQLAEVEILGRNGDVQAAAFFALNNSPDQRGSILTKENLDVAEQLQGSSAMHRFLNSAAALPQDERTEFCKEVPRSAILDYGSEIQAAAFEAIKTSPEQRDAILKINKENLDFAKRIKGRTAKSLFLKCAAALPQNQQAEFRTNVENSTILTYNDVRQAEAFEATARYPQQHGSILDKDNVAFGAQLVGGFTAYLESTAAMSQGQQAAFHEAIKKSTILRRDYMMQADAFEVTAQYPQRHGSFLNRENVRFGARLHREAFNAFLKSTAAISQDPGEQDTFRHELDKSDIWDRDAETQTQAFEDIATSPDNHEAILSRIKQPVPIRIGTPRKILPSLRGKKYPSAFSLAGPSRKTPKKRKDGPPPPALGFSEFVLDRSSGESVPIRVKAQSKHNLPGSNAYTITDDSDKNKGTKKMDRNVQIVGAGPLETVLEICSDTPDLYFRLERDSRKNWQANGTGLVRPKPVARVFDALRGARSAEKGKDKESGRGSRN